MREVLVSLDAQADIDEIAAYIALDNPGVAYRFIDATEDAYQLLARFPNLGTIWISDNPLHERIRKLAVPGFRKYLIFYRPTDTEIEIIHVFDSRRDLPRLF